MQQEWKPGHRVTVVTVNRGQPPAPQGDGQDRGRAGEIVRPSLVGPDWWNVKRDTPRGEKHGTAVYAVPGEIMPRD